jgi:cysteine desulfurase
MTRHASDLAGVTVLITAGPTQENIDPVRYISNRSSGKMGYALATNAQRRGARVTLLSGPVALPPPEGVKVVPITTAAELSDEVMARAPSQDLLIMAAAVADYRVAHPSEQKVKRGEGALTLTLEPNPDILAAASKARRGPRPLIVGFALETDQLLRAAQDKLIRKGCELLVANLAAEALATDSSVAYILDASGVIDEPGRLPKAELADRILDRALERLAPRGFIYLDFNATTPVDPRVAEAMSPYLTGFYGNPSSTHRLGREARAAVERARGQVAACLGASSDEIVFTSGGSESNNLAIRGAVEGTGRGHVITSSVEHPAVLEVVRALEAEGKIELTIVGVDAEGRVAPAAIAAALRPDTILVTVMLANNEVGTLQPIAEIARVCRDRGGKTLVHTDASQAIGKVPVAVGDLDVDLLTLAGHKLYAPKGIGALYVRRGVKLTPQIRGAGHERGLRAGTENVLEQVGLGRACELVAAEVEFEGHRLEELRERLVRRLIDGLSPLQPVIHARGATRLPNTLSIALQGMDANQLLERLTDEVAASAGAACHAGDVKISPVLAAMGVEPELARCTVRLSVGRPTTEAEVDEAARRILAVLTSSANSGV